MVPNSPLQAAESLDLLRIAAQFTWRCGRDLRIESVEILDAECGDETRLLLQGIRLDRLAEQALYPAERRSLDAHLQRRHDFSDASLTLAGSFTGGNDSRHLVLSARAMRDPTGAFAGFAGFGRVGRDRPFDALQRQELVAQLQRTEAARAREQQLRLESEALLASLRALHEPVPLADKCRAILNAFAPLLAFEAAVVVRRGANGDLVVVASTLGDGGRLTWPEGDLIASALAGDASIHADLCRHRDVRRLGPPLDRYCRAGLFAPLRIGHEHAVLIALHSRPDAFDKPHLGTMQRLGLVAAQAFEADESRSAIINASKLATLGEMLAAIAHEVNQPLSVISMAVQNARLMIESNAPTAEILEKLKLTDGQARRAGDIVKAIRSLAHPNRSTTPSEPVSLDHVLESLATLCQGMLRGRGIALVLDVPEGCREVLADPGGLEQVLLNLVVNARDAIMTRMERQPGPGQIAIEVEDTRGDDRVRLRVIDNGGGIPADVIGRIFDPFFTLKDVGKGTGLGLSICRSLLTEMQSALSVRNEAEGAVFEIELRTAPVEPDNATAQVPGCYSGHTAR